MIDKLNFNLRRTSNGGIFHDSREDVRTLTEALNRSIDKINELVIVVNRQGKEIKALKASNSREQSPPKKVQLSSNDWDEILRERFGYCNENRK